jgi:hypothetical protein
MQRDAIDPPPPNGLKRTFKGVPGQIVRHAEIQPLKP